MPHHIKRNEVTACRISFALPATILFLFISAFSSFSQTAVDENLMRSFLFYPKCNFDTSSSVIVLDDEANLRFNNSFELELNRTVYIKFLQPTVYSDKLNDVLFYHSKNPALYKNLSAFVYSQDPQLNIASKDVRNKINAGGKLTFEKGNVLAVKYSLKFPLTKKMPMWRIQQAYPVEKNNFQFTYPELINVGIDVPTIVPDMDKGSSYTREFRNQSATVNERKLMFIQIPPFSNLSYVASAADNAQKIALRVYTIKQNTAQIQPEKIEGDKGKALLAQLVKQKDFLPKLSAKFELQKGYDVQIKAIADTKVKVGRIYDLVRRHFRWNKADSLFVDPKKNWDNIWSLKTATGSEINFMLVKLLMNYGFETYPALVSTRNHGKVDMEFPELSDFNRIIAIVYLEGKVIPLDATQSFGDYPILSPEVLNTQAFVCNANKDRWVNVEDQHFAYENRIVLLGTLLGDSIFRTNAYFNSLGYSKAERVLRLEQDSLRGFRKHYFPLPFGSVKHLITANEYVDSLPLAQEFDFNIPVAKEENIRRVNIHFFGLPDSLKTISENRPAPLDFGWLQKYNWKCEFSFPDNYESYLLPASINLSILEGDVAFTSNYHANTHSVSCSYLLDFKRSSFTVAESKEIAKLLKKIFSIQSQAVLIKKNY